MWGHERQTDTPTHAHAPHFRWLCPLTFCPTAQLQEALHARGEKVLAWRVSGWSCTVCVYATPPPTHTHTYTHKKKRKKTQRGPWPAVFHPLYMLQATISGLLWKRQRLDSENNSVSDTNQPFLNFTECDTTFWTKTFEGPLHLYFAMSRWNVLVHVTLHFKFSKDFFILKIENI